MAGRVLLRRLSSSRGFSTSLLGGADASASATAARARMQAASYSKALPCTRAAPGRGGATVGLPSVIIPHPMRPASVGSVGSKRTFSSRQSSKDAVSCEPKAPTCDAEWEAKWEAASAASKAEFEAWNAKVAAKDAAFDRFVAVFTGSWCLIFLSIWTTDFGSSCCGASSCKGQCGSLNDAQVAASGNPSVQNPNVTSNQELQVP